MATGDAAVRAGAFLSVTATICSTCAAAAFYNALLPATGAKAWVRRWRVFRAAGVEW